MIHTSSGPDFSLKGKRSNLSIIEGVLILDFKCNSQSQNRIYKWNKTILAVIPSLTNLEVE